MRLLAALLVAVSLGACRPECIRDMLATVPSPDRQYVATVFGEDCHATSPYLVSINLRPPDQKFDPHDVVFVLHGEDVLVRWDTPRRLVVRYPRGQQTYRRERRWHDVDIVYEIMPP